MIDNKHPFGGHSDLVIPGGSSEPIQFLKKRAMKIICLALGFWFFLFNFAVASSGQIQILTFDQKALPQEMHYKGEIVAGARWSDRNGENLLLLWETGPFKSPKQNPGDDEAKTAQLHGYHYVRARQRHTLLWKFFDYMEFCQFDLVVCFRNTFH